MVVGFPSVKTACYYSVVYGLSNSGRHTDTLRPRRPHRLPLLLSDLETICRRRPFYSPDFSIAVMFWSSRDAAKIKLIINLGIQPFDAKYWIHSQ